MRPVSPGFLAALTGSHNITTRVRAVPAGQTGVSPIGGTALPHVRGDVTLDGSADIRATAEVELAPSDPETGELLWPTGASAPLTPYGATELFIERGIVFGGGSVEYVSLGYFRINDVEQSAAPDGPIRVSGADRMANIIDAKLTAPLQFGPTLSYGTVVEQLVTDAYAAAVIEWDDETELEPIGRTALVDEDRYSFLRELVTGVGKVAYFDHRGVLVIRTPPSASLPLWSVARGRRGVLVSAGRSLSREGVANGVLATGEALDTAPPARGLAVDADSASPTRWGGPFGKVPRLFASPLLTTDQQCRLAAETVLRRSVGLPYNVDFSAVPNPALEPDDPIAIGIEGEPELIEPTLIVGDSFSRTVVGGLGSSESGHAWTTSADNQVNGGIWHRTQADGTAAAVLLPAAVGRRDIDVVVDVQVPELAAGASLVAGVVLRYQSTSDYYALRIEFDTDGLVTFKLGDHGTPYAEPFILAGAASYAAGQWWSIRGRSFGRTLQFKAWPQSGAEPSEWLYTYTDARPGAVGHVNRYGMYFWRVAGNTNATAPQYRIDNYRAFSVPPSPLSNGELHVLDTVTIPLAADAAMRGTTREQTLVTIESSS